MEQGGEHNAIQRLGEWAERAGEFCLCDTTGNWFNKKRTQFLGQMTKRERNGRRGCEGERGKVIRDRLAV